MRKIIYLAFLSIIALPSCKDEPIANFSDVKFICGLQDSRAETDGAIWNAGDVVGIYMIKAEPGALAAANILADNRQYIALNGTSNNFIEVDGNPIYYPIDGSKVKFLAYYPYSSAPTADYHLPINLNNQSNQSAIDLRYVPVTTLSYSNTSYAPVQLNFSHKLSKLIFNITNGGGVGEPVANGITLVIPGQQTVGSLDLTDGRVSSSGPISDIIIQSVGMGTTVIAEAVIFPGSTSGTELTFTNNAGQEFTVEVPNTFWYEGNKYIYKVTLGGDGKIDISGTISAWDDNGNDYDMSILEDLSQRKYPYNIDISGADFSNCYIYEIWDEINNIKIGELCKEYLYKLTGGTAVVRKQAIVAYPMLLNGKADLANGLVVETGHFVAWNPNPVLSAPTNILTSYTVGETVSSMPSMIYLGVGATRMTTINLSVTPAERINAALKPYIFRDQRSGPTNNVGSTSEDYSYRVVKVGTQYWMADNLRTSRFRDGTNIPTDIATSAITAVGDPLCIVIGYYNDTGTSSVNANNTAVNYTTIRNEVGLGYTYNAIVNQSGVSTAQALTPPLEDMISPAGWKVPERAQFEMLRNYVTQSTAVTATIMELALEGTGEYGNATGFSLRLGRYRQGSLAAVATVSLLASMEYLHDPSNATDYNTHRFYCLRMGTTVGAFSVSNENLYACRATAYIRCLRQE